MSAHIGNLKDENGNTFYPVTKTNAVLDENGNSLENMVVRDSNGDIQTNAIRSNNVKSYAKNFYNNNGSARYCHIGTLKVGGANNFFAGKIYTAQGYGDNDTIQEIVDFNVEINSNNNLRGFATCDYNFYSNQEEIKMYFVPTSNSLEWEVYLKMHQWSNALVEISMSAPSATDYKFTFDSSDANFISYPDNSVLTIEPRKPTNYTENEVVIGTWTNGKPIYRKVFNYTTSNTNQSWANFQDCSSLGISAIIRIYGSIGDGYNWVNLPVSEGQYYRNFRYDISSKYLQHINNGFNNASGYIAIEYIKN